MPVSSRYYRMRRSVLACCSLVPTAFPKRRMAFVTVTYHSPGIWHKNHISSLVTHYREWGRTRGFAIPYVWVCEIQYLRAVRSGISIPHYHLLLWLPKGETPPKPDKQGWWPHGSSNAKFVHTPVAYLAKYLSKSAGPGSYPKGARLWGFGGLTKALREQLSWYKAPSWLRKLVPEGHHVVKQGEWWVDMVHKIRYRTPFVMEFGLYGYPEFKELPWMPDDVEFF